MTDVLGRKFYELHLLHFLVQRALLLANQKLYSLSHNFLHMKHLVPTESSRCFSLAISGLGGEGKLWVVGMFTMAVKMYLV